MSLQSPTVIGTYNWHQLARQSVNGLPWKGLHHSPARFSQSEFGLSLKLKEIRFTFVLGKERAVCSSKGTRGVCDSRESYVAEESS